MKQTHKVVMLATEDETGLLYSTTLGYGYQPSLQRCKDHQHLYILSDEEIKEGDWVLLIYPRRSMIKQMIEGEPFQNAKCINSEIKHDHAKHKKVIVSTDQTLKLSTTGYTEERSRTFYSKLPQIHQDFVEAYVEAGGIDEVSLEYDTILSDGWVPTYQNPDNSGCEPPAEPIDVLKLRDDNTVIIHKAKMYSEAEMISFAKYAKNHIAPNSVEKAFTSWSTNN